MKELIKNTGRTDDDFRRDVDDKLNMNLFPELTEKLTPVIENDPYNPYQNHLNHMKFNKRYPHTNPPPYLLVLKSLYVKNRKSQINLCGK